MVKTVVAVVVTYNRLSLLKENISALKQLQEPVDILVIDNHSTDNTYEYLIQNNIDTIRLEENTGGAGGFYTGIKEAIKRKYDYVWIMDDDTIPYPQTLQTLLAAADKVNGDFGFLCSYVEWVDGSPCVMNRPNIFSPCEKKDAQALDEGLVRCDRASFVSMLLSASAIKAVGLPLKEFFIWGDDTEYSKRIADYRTSYFVIASRVLHKMSNNTPTDIIKDTGERLERYRYLYRNQTYMSKKTGIKGTCMHSAYMLYQLLKIATSKSNHKIRKVGIVLAGWLAGISFDPQIEYYQD